MLEGEVGDVIVGAALPPPGTTMFEKMRAMERHQDHPGSCCASRVARQRRPQGSNLVLPAPTKPCRRGDDADHAVGLWEVAPQGPGCRIHVL